MTMVESLVLGRSTSRILREGQARVWEYIDRGTVGICTSRLIYSSIQYFNILYGVIHGDTPQLRQQRNLPRREPFVLLSPPLRGPILGFLFLLFRLL